MNKRNRKRIKNNRTKHNKLVLKTRGVVGPRECAKPDKILNPVKKKKKRTKKVVNKIWPNYQTYCRSKEFKKLKRRVYNKYGKICFFDFCKNEAYTIHHLKYRRWGTEKLSDCRPVCRYHHLYGMHNDIAVNKMLEKMI